VILLNVIRCRMSGGIFAVTQGLQGLGTAFEVGDPAAALHDIPELKGQFAEGHTFDAVEAPGGSVLIVDGPPLQIGKTEAGDIQDPGIIFGS